MIVCKWGVVEETGDNCHFLCITQAAAKSPIKHHIPCY